MHSFKYILLIDDDEAVLFYNRFIIEREEICDTILESIDYPSAIKNLEFLRDQSLENVSPSLIVIDINMPMYSGFELIEKHKSLFEELKNKGISIVFLTSSNNPNDLEKIKFNPIIKKYFEKPIKPIELTQLLSEMI